MTYYKAYIGSWNDKDGVRLIAEGFKRGEIIKAATEEANKTGKVVSIRAEKGSARGVKTTTYKVQPM